MEFFFVGQICSSRTLEVMWYICQNMWPSALLPSHWVFLCVCVCVFCNPSVSPKEWVCFVKLWPVFSPLSSTHLSLCCSCHFISQLPTGRLTKEYGKAVVSIYSLSFLLSLLYRFFIVCVCEFVCFCSHVYAKLFCVSVRRKPEDLSREVIQIQQREFALKEQNYTLNSR